MHAHITDTYSYGRMCVCVCTCTCVYLCVKCVDVHACMAMYIAMLFDKTEASVVHGYHYIIYIIMYDNIHTGTKCYPRILPFYSVVTMFLYI